MAPRVWLITGCSSGFGSEIALAALARGERVIATGRKIEALQGLKEKGATTLALDVRESDEEVNKVVATAHETYGRLDVLVNNAGYILDGTIEACSSEEVEAQYGVNVFGLLRMVRAVLPFMRAQRSGVVCNLGSVGGWRGTPMGGIYCSTKFAVAGITEALKSEEEPFGIDVTVVEPGYFRTNFLSTNNRISAAKKIPDLDGMTQKLSAVFDMKSGKQPGDPVKGASIIVDILTKSGPWAACEKLPVRIPLGADSVRFIREILEERAKVLGQWASIAETTNCDDVAN